MPVSTYMFLTPEQARELAIRIASSANRVDEFRQVLDRKDAYDYVLLGKDLEGGPVKIRIGPEGQKP